MVLVIRVCFLEVETPSRVVPWHLLCMHILYDDTFYESRDNVIPIPLLPASVGFLSHVSLRVCIPTSAKYLALLRIICTAY